MSSGVWSFDWGFKPEPNKREQRCLDAANRGLERIFPNMLTKMCWQRFLFTRDSNADIASQILLA